MQATESAVPNGSSTFGLTAHESIRPFVDAASPGGCPIMVTPARQRFQFEVHEGWGFFADRGRDLPHAARILSARTRPLLRPRCIRQTDETHRRNSKTARVLPGTLREVDDHPEAIAKGSFLNHAVRAEKAV